MRLEHAAYNGSACNAGSGNSNVRVPVVWTVRNRGRQSDAGQASSALGPPALRGVAVFDRLRYGPRVKPEAVLFDAPAYVSGGSSTERNFGEPAGGTRLKPLSPLILVWCGS
jgi:hypothetical protein